MCRDCYELDMPEPTWLDQFQENKEFMTFAALSIGIPTGLAVLSAVLVKLADKRK